MVHNTRQAQLEFRLPAPEHCLQGGHWVGYKWTCSASDTHLSVDDCFSHSWALTPGEGLARHRDSSAHATLRSQRTHMPAHAGIQSQAHTSYKNTLYTSSKQTTMRPHMRASTHTHTHTHTHTRARARAHVDSNPKQPTTMLPLPPPLRPILGRAATQQARRITPQPDRQADQGARRGGRAAGGGAGGVQGSCRAAAAPICGGEQQAQGAGGRGGPTQEFFMHHAAVFG